MRLIATICAELRPEEWLVIEWPQTEAEPTKYWLSILPPDIAFDRLLDAIKLRWRIAPENMRTRR
jgi:SRSO17 transposase